MALFGNKTFFMRTYENMSQEQLLQKIQQYAENNRELGFALGAARAKIKQLEENMFEVAQQRDELEKQCSALEDQCAHLQSKLDANQGGTMLQKRCLTMVEEQLNSVLAIVQRGLSADFDANDDGELGNSAIGQAGSSVSSANSSSQSALAKASRLPAFQAPQSSSAFAPCDRRAWGRVEPAWRKSDIYEEGEESEQDADRNHEHDNYSSAPTTPHRGHESEFGDGDYLMEEAEEEEEEETPQEERQHTMEGRVVASREREREGESACGSSGSANTKRAARAKSEPHSEEPTDKENAPHAGEGLRPRRGTQRRSYAEPTLKAKLRQGMEHTFGTPPKSPARHRKKSDGVHKSATKALQQQEPETGSFRSPLRALPKNCEF